MDSRRGEPFRLSVFCLLYSAFPALRREVPDVRGALGKKECVHYNEMARASAHHEEMEDLMASEILMPAVKNRKLQRIDDAADRINNTSGKKPAERRR